MLKQETNNRTQHLEIHIPLTKRYHLLSQPSIRVVSISDVFLLEGRLQSLRIEMSEYKPQLDLSNQRSGFTRVFQTKEDSQDSLKFQQIPAQANQDKNEKFFSVLQKFIERISPQTPEVTKQHKQLSFNTKNILRNMCNAQNQYVLFNSSAQRTIEAHLKNPKKFKTWVNKLRFHTFEEYQQVWDIKNKGIYSKLYKKLCKKFYTQNAIPYIINSRIKNKQTKLAHIRYLYRFLQGIEKPEDFFYFKQKEKQGKLRAS